MVATFTDDTGGPAMMIGQSAEAYTSRRVEHDRHVAIPASHGGKRQHDFRVGYGTTATRSGSASITSMTTNAGVGGGGTSSLHGRERTR